MARGGADLGRRPLVCLDETGITTNLLRRYGRAPRGARVHDHAPCGRWQTSTFLAALRVTGLTAPGVFDGAIDGESFRTYIDQILVPTLQPGDIVIADNLGAHKVAGIQRALQAAGATLWYLHPIARTSIPSSSASRSSRPSFAPHAVAAARRSGRSSVTVSSISALTNAATISGTAGTRSPHGHEKRSSSGLQRRYCQRPRLSRGPLAVVDPKPRVGQGAQLHQGFDESARATRRK